MATKCAINGRQWGAYDGRRHTGTAKDNRPLGYDSLTILLKVEEKYRPVGAAELVRNVTAGPLALPSGILEDLLKQASEVDVDSNSGENLGEGKVE